VFRHIENGDAKTLAMMAKLQSTLFGMNGLPDFQMLNNSVLGNAAGNVGHKDMYSTLPNLMDGNLSKWLLYGSVSNVLGAGVYGRGDINPRQVSVIPVNPLDYPAISGAVRFTGAMLDMASNIAHGGSVPGSLMLGMEHNALSRPLSGLGQMMQGFATTGQGSLIATTRPPLGDNGLGWNDVINFANMSRLAGARPLDEAIIMDARYRNTMYQAKDVTRREAIGEAVKTYMYGSAQDSGQDTNRLTPQMVQAFAGMYAATGGRIQEFSQQMQKWTSEANASVANDIFRNLKQPNMQQLQSVMGGQPLADYRNQGASSANDMRVNNPFQPRRAPDGGLYQPDPGRPGFYMRLN